MTNKLIAGLVVLVGVLAGFYGGTKFGQAHPTAAAASTTTTTTRPSAGTGATGAGGRAGNFGGPAAAGQIVAVGDGTITVQDRQTGKQVKVSVGSARITKTVQGTTADLTQNQTVTVIGQTGSDGTVNAQAISIGGGFGGAGGRGRPSPSPST